MINMLQKCLKNFIKKFYKFFSIKNEDDKVSLSKLILLIFKIIMLIITGFFLCLTLLISYIKSTVPNIIEDVIMENMSQQVRPIYKDCMNIAVGSSNKKSEDQALLSFYICMVDKLSKVDNLNNESKEEYNTYLQLIIEIYKNGADGINPDLAKMKHYKKMLKSSDIDI